MWKADRMDTEQSVGPRGRIIYWTQARGCTLELSCHSCHSLGSLNSLNTSTDSTKNLVGPLYVFTGR